MNLLELTCAQLTDLFRRKYGRGAYHAQALYRAFYAAADVELNRLPEFAGSAQLLSRVRLDIETDPPAVSHCCTEEGVTKLVFRLRDGLSVESVIVPMERHTTLCISSQVGCRMGCRFCETGRVGLLRPLTVAEIVGQVYMVKAVMGLSVRNVVFMGMGEPLDNLDNVIQAVRVMEDQRGLNIAKRRITVSTAGLIEGIRRLAGLGWPQLKLAVSLNASDDAVRSYLMPVNRRHDMAALKKALADYPLARGNVLFIEYVLIRGVNDRPEDARRLAHYLVGLPVRVNLIAYNPRRGSDLEAPSESEVQLFLEELTARQIFVRPRRSKGSAIRAACGQLGASAPPGHCGS